MAASITYFSASRLAAAPSIGRRTPATARPAAARRTPHARFVVTAAAKIDAARARVLPFVGALAAAAVVLPCCKQTAVAAEFGQAQLNHGAAVFTNNCATCHTGGQNVIESEKTLERDALVEYLDGGFSTASIERQVRNGKGSMPAWADSLSPQDIQDVAAYVYNQADKELW